MVQYPNYKIENPQPLQHQNQCLFWIHHAQLPQTAHRQIGMEFQESEENGSTLLKVQLRKYETAPNFIQFKVKLFLKATFFVITFPYLR